MSETLVCMCDGKLGVYFSEESRQALSLMTKRTCECKYTLKRFLEISEKYSYKNGRWKKDGKAKAEKELMKDGMP
jgi:hypothetical protein